MSGTTVMEYLPLPQMSQIYADMFPTCMKIYSRGLMRGSKRWRCVTYAASSILLMVKSNCTIFSVRNRMRMVAPKGGAPHMTCP